MTKKEFENTTALANIMLAQRAMCRVIPGTTSARKSDVDAVNKSLEKIFQSLIKVTKPHR